MPGAAAMKTFEELSDREVLALAITSEEEDGRIYQGFAEGARADNPATARLFEGMAAEERAHRDSLYALFRLRHGEHMPLVRREDVAGAPRRAPFWLAGNLGAERMRREAEAMEEASAAFYERAAARTTDVEVRRLLVRLAEVERGHRERARDLTDEHLTPDARAKEADGLRRRFVLQYVQPGLAGLMDGSVSTLAPLFAAAFATHSNWSTFLIGLASAIGAGISMGFAEALSDDGKISGRGAPWARGAVCGLMTTLGGVFHTLPYLIPDAWSVGVAGHALGGVHLATALALVVVLVELWAIAWVRARYMDTPFLKAALQVVVGGALVLATGVLIGAA